MNVSADDWQSFSKAHKKVAKGAFLIFFSSLRCLGGFRRFSPSCSKFQKGNGSHGYARAESAFYVTPDLSGAAPEPEST